MPLKKLFRSAHSSAQSLPDISAGSTIQPESPDNHWTDIWGVLREAPDRGKWNDAHWKSRAVQRSLVEAGRHAGRSRVEYVAPNIGFHLLTRDFFITAINTQTKWLVLIIFAIYLALSFAWSVPYYLLLRYSPGCIYGAETYVEMWTFSFITMMTIGYGNTGPQACWAASWVIAIQSISSLLVEAVTIGIIFARISHPKQRGRSIFISDSAVIARRDGVLKFMFRVADIRRTQVVDPKIKAFMYTWGEGRVTAEGERIPVRCEAIDTGYIDGMLILPLTIEHTIDEKSPLCGHTHDSLVALDAELVVTFEGTTEFGNPFMARRSYVPSDLAWGHQFVDIICRPAAGETHYTIDLDRFHDTRPQEGLPPLPPAPLSQLVVSRAKRTVPYPLLGDNTLALADSLVLYRGSDGGLRLAARAADTYPNQALDVTARMYLYRWSDADAVEPGQPPVSIVQLECGYVDGTDRLHLRLPVEVAHVIDASSPLAAWDGPDATAALRADADAEVVVVLSGYLYSTSENVLRQRTYVVSRHVRAGCVFADIVKHPALTKDRKPRVRWARFHDVVPQQGEFLEDGAEEEVGASANSGLDSAFADAPAPSE
ncbi:inward potassium channel rectifier, partial [Helicosporidium sp. ATCC 50920]